jgi:hypothetical protein
MLVSKSVRDLRMHGPAVHRNDIDLEISVFVQACAASCRWYREGLPEQSLNSSAIEVLGRKNWDYRYSHGH